MRSLIFLLLLSFNATAALYDRGNGLIYDDVLDITWLQDANYAQTSGFSNDGRMDWNNANTWASNLIFAGQSDWRLPSTLAPDTSCSYQISAESRGYNCNGSEMGNLFYETLGNTADSLTNTGQFSNVQADHYWSMTEGPSNLYEEQVWYFFFNNGYQDLHGKSGFSRPWPVHDGDIGASPVPLPAGIYLFLSGLVGLGFMRGRNG